MSSRPNLTGWRVRRFRRTCCRRAEVARCQFEQLRFEREKIVAKPFNPRFPCLLMLTGKCMFMERRTRRPDGRTSPPHLTTTSLTSRRACEELRWNAVLSALTSLMEPLVPTAAARSTKSHWSGEFSLDHSPHQTPPLSVLGLYFLGFLVRGAQGWESWSYCERMEMHSP